MRGEVLTGGMWPRIYNVVEKSWAGGISGFSGNLIPRWAESLVNVYKRETGLLSSRGPQSLPSLKTLCSGPWIDPRMCQAGCAGIPAAFSLEVCASARTRMLSPRPSVRDGICSPLGWSSCHPGRRLIFQPRPFFLPPPSPQASPWGHRLLSFLWSAWPLTAVSTF